MLFLAITIFYLGLFSGKKAFVLNMGQFDIVKQVTLILLLLLLLLLLFWSLTEWTWSIEDQSIK